MEEINIKQSVGILVDGNNMDKSANTFGEHMMLDYDNFVPRLIGRRSLSRFFYLREGKSISKKLAERLHNKFYGIVKPCHKSADVPLTIEAVQLVDKVDTIIILSGDSDYIELVKYLSARGCRTEIAAFRFSASQALIEAADFYHEITADDCFTTERPKEDGATVPDTKPDSATVTKSTQLPKTKRKHIIKSGTLVENIMMPGLRGHVQSYDENEKCYFVGLESGETIKWARSAFTDLSLKTATN